MKAKLTIIHKNGLEELKTVKLAGSELIEVQDKKGEYAKKRLYTTVRPRVQEENAKPKRLMFYCRYGEPFTFDPYSGDIFSDEKKRNILIENGLGYPVTIGDKRIVILLKRNEDGTTSKDEPEWRKEVMERYKNLNIQTMHDLEVWLKENQDILHEERYHEIPAYTEYDLSKIDMAREENYEIIKSETIKEGFRSMAGIGRKEAALMMFITFAITFILTLLIFFYFANDGVFTQGTTREVVEKPPEMLRLVMAWLKR